MANDIELLLVLFQVETSIIFVCLKSLRKLYLLLHIWSQISIHLLRETPKNSRIELPKIIGHPGVGCNFQ